MSAPVLAMAASLVLAATAASAADPWVGRWAPDTKDCSGTSGSALWPLQVTPLALRWPAALCTVYRSYKIGRAWHVGARCSGEGGLRTVPLRLQMRGDRLVLDRGSAPAEELRRCP